jgi:hypothetical protein
MTKRLLALLMATFIACSIVLVGGLMPARAGTVPPSIISSDTTWTVANSPYELSGPVLVPSDVTLTIEPGVLVNLKTYYLQINGTLRAIGTNTNPVTLNSSTVNAGKILFTSSTNWNEQTGAGSIIKNAVINQTVISIIDCSVKISDNTINAAADMMNSNSAINTQGGSSIIANNHFISSGLDISDSSIITNNVITGGIGLYQGSPQVTKNTISGGSSYFWIGRSFDRDYNTVVISCSAIVSENHIMGSIILNGYRPVSALITGNTISGMIHDGEGLVNNLTISNNKCGPISLDATDSLTITHNLITNAETGLTIGNATVKDNTIVDCKTAIQLNKAAAPTLSGNNLLNSSQYNLKLSGELNVDASNNYWGTADQGAIASSIYDRKNDFNLGTVTFTPFLTAANPNAPPLDYSPVPEPLPTKTPQPSTPQVTPQTTSQPTPQPTEKPLQQSPPADANPPATDTIIVPLLVGIIVVLLALLLLTNRKRIAATKV